MKPLNLFFLSIVIVTMTPHSSFAQMQTYRSNNMSGQNRVSTGMEVINEKINRIIMIDGQANDQTVTFFVRKRKQPQ